MAEYCCNCFIEKLDPNARIEMLNMSNEKDFCEGCGVYDYYVTGYKLTRRKLQNDISNNQ